MGKLSMNYMLVKIRSKILSDRIAMLTFLELRWKYILCVLLTVKLTFSSSFGY